MSDYSIVDSIDWTAKDVQVLSTMSIYVRKTHVRFDDVSETGNPLELHISTLSSSHNSLISSVVPVGQLVTTV